MQDLIKNKIIVVDDVEFTYSDKIIYKVIIVYKSDIGEIVQNNIYKYNIILETKDTYYYFEELFSDYENGITLDGIFKKDITTTEDNLNEMKQNMHLNYLSIELYFLDYDLAKKYYDFFKQSNIQKLHIESILKKTEALIKTREEELELLKKDYEELKARKVD